MTDGVRIEKDDTNNPILYQAVTVEEGKLYKFFYQYQGGGTSGGLVRIGTTVNGSEIYDVSLGASDSASVTKMFEASADDTWYVSLWNSTGAGGQWYEFDNVHFHEVTPGCVAADNKAPDGWTKDATLDLHRVHNDGGTLTQDGSFYSLKWTPSASGDYMNYPSFGGSDHWYRRFAGRTVTLGAWVKTDLASHFRIGFYDGSDRLSSYHGASGWEWMEYTRTLADDITNFTILFSSASPSSNHNAIYISQPMLVFGSSIGEGNYTRPQGEIVWFENKVEALNSFNTTTYDDESNTVINLESESNGGIPKGIQAIYLRAEARDSGSASGNCYFQIGEDVGDAAELFLDIGSNSLYMANNHKHTITGWSNCNSDGDIEFNSLATGSDTIDLTIYPFAVQLR